MYDNFNTSCTGKTTARKTTIGWELIYKWRYRSYTWVTLKDLEKFDPIQVTEYAISNKISE